MVLIRPRLNDYHDLGFAQEEVEFAIPFLDEDIPLYVDPFLLWKSPSLQDNSLHTALLSSFNHLGYLARTGKKEEAIRTLVALSECREVGLGNARDKRGHKIGEATAREILALFSGVPQVQQAGFDHIEEIQLFVDQIGSDRISDLTCSLVKSFLIDFTLDQCTRLGVPVTSVDLPDVFDYRSKTLKSERLDLPVNPNNGSPILFVPKRWLRRQTWISFDGYLDTADLSAIGVSERARIDRVAILNYNRNNYDMVQVYVREKERTQADCRNDPLFRPIPVLSARRKLTQIIGLPSGKDDNADKEYEDCVCQLMASLLYPYLDFAAEQSRTDSGSLIRDLIFYNSRSMDFLHDLYKDFEARQLVFEVKNVREIERLHINQLNRYLAGQFGRFGVIVTRHPLPRSVFRNTVDLWSGQRKCIIALTDEDLKLMVTVFESKQRIPIEVLKRSYLDFVRACPS